MTPNTAETDWEGYRQHELAEVTPLLVRHGYVLEDEQPHTQGERHLMHAVTTTSGKKLILLGRRTRDDVRVVIKVTSDPNGAQELKHERRARKLLNALKFAYEVFHTPEELLFLEEAGITLSIQRFIPQQISFLERPLREQFFFALNAFKAQEGTRATTHNHLRAISRVYPMYGSAEYLATLGRFVAECKEQTSILPTLHEVADHLQTYRVRIEQYCGFLTHTDFVPHNFRIAGSAMYLLDYSSLRFGNKHDGWARFMNFMTLYHPELDTALTAYVRDNRAPEELESLSLMRLFRLGEIITYYVRATQVSDGSLKKLNSARVIFWHEVLTSRMADVPLAADTRTAYINLRDSLRSEEEKRRQVGLH